LTADVPVLQLYHPTDNRLPSGCSDGVQARSEKASQLSEQSDIEMAILDEGY